MSEVLHALLQAADERQAQLWHARSDPAAYVGTKHHTVPAFCLREFTDDGKRLLVWRRSTGRVDPGPVTDLAIRDFYTFLNTDEQPDGRMEEMLGRVENDAAEVFRLLQSPFRRPVPPSAEQRVKICQFLAFQMVRGPRKRREIELLADYGWKLLADGQMTEKDQRELTIVPHPNEHISLMAGASFEIFRSILHRPVQIVTLDAPLLVIGDEPVIVDNEDHVQHLPECSLSQRELRRRRRPGGRDRFEQPIHVWPTKPSGVQPAEAIGMPISPSALVVLGRVGEALQLHERVVGDEAEALAHDVNSALVAQAYEWVAARPSHPAFADWTFPPAGPLIGVCDGGSTMSEQLRSTPSHRWQRFRKDWPGTRSRNEDHQPSGAA